MANKVMKSSKIKSMVRKAGAYYTEEEFVQDAKDYAKAVESGRILYDVVSVANSGMSRALRVRSYEGKLTNGYYRTYIYMFTTLGYKFRANKDYFSVHGTGMDMVWYTNYEVIETLQELGILYEKRARRLRQKVRG